MTIKDAIRSGRLPNTVNVNFILKACNTLNIPAKDLNFDLTSEQLRRLQFSPIIHVNSVNAEVKSAHDALSNKYQNLINKYSNLSYYMGKSGYLGEAKEEIDHILSELEKAKNGYDDVIANIHIAKDGLGFDNNVLNPIDSVIKDINDERISKNSDKLSVQYQKLDELNSKDYKTKFKKSINQKRINRVNARIRRLQAKQGKMQATQKKIVNKGSSKYAKAKMKEMNKFLTEYNRYRVYGDLKASLKQSRDNYQHDIEQTQIELDNLQGKTGLINGARRIKNNIDMAIMNANMKKFNMQEKAVERLRSKPGRCKLSEQYYRTITRALAA